MSIAAVRGIGVAVITSTSGVRSSPALGAQQVALLDAEAVLLVDDREPEVGELDALVDQRVRADERCRSCPSRSPSAMRRRSAALRAVREQRHAHRPLAEQRARLGDGQPARAARAP